MYIPCTAWTSWNIYEIHTKSQCDNPPGQTGLNILYWRSMVKYGGSRSTCHLPWAPRVSHQRGGPPWLHPHHEPTLSTLNSVKQHINQRTVQMSARTSACFKNDHHTYSYLVVWSPHEDKLSFSCLKNLHWAISQSLLGRKWRSSGNIYFDCRLVRNLGWWCSSHKNLMKEFMMFENVLSCFAVFSCRCHLYQCWANTIGVIQSMIHNEVVPAVIYHIQSHGGPADVSGHRQCWCVWTGRALKKYLCE